MDEEMELKGEKFSITDVNRRYLQQNRIILKDLGNEVWLDCGTPDNLLIAAQYAKDGALSPIPCNFKEGDSRIGWSE